MRTGCVNRPLPSYFVLLFLGESSCETSHKKMGGIYMEKKLKRETHFHMDEFCTKGRFTQCKRELGNDWMCFVQTGQGTWFSQYLYPALATLLINWMWLTLVLDNVTFSVMNNALFLNIMCFFLYGFTGLARAKSVPTKTYSNEVVTLWYVLWNLHISCTSQ